MRDPACGLTKGVISVMFLMVESVCSGSVVGAVCSTRGGVFGAVGVDFGELLRYPSRQNVGVKHVRSG